MSADLKRLGRVLGHSFTDPDLLTRALTHRSFSAVHNERLEFLGDGVVNCAVAAALYRKFPDLPEGDLSRLRASLVSQPSLAEIAISHDLGSLLRLGEGELKSGGAKRPSMLADAVEAVIGAVFLDGGYASAERAVDALFRRALDDIDPGTTGKDAKTLLQELLQARRLNLPQYLVLAVYGEAHDQTFHVACDIAELGVRTEGRGSSRRAAEQEAARRAYAQAKDS